METVVKKRSIGLFVFLTIITGGIYGIVIFCIASKDIEKICEGDGKHTMFFLWAGLLGLVTLGIYPLVWFYQAMERLKDNGYRYQVEVKHGGGEFLLWYLLGSFIAVGPFVAECYFLSDVNQFSDFVGIVNPAPYTSNPIERLDLKKNWVFYSEDNGDDIIGDDVIVETGDNIGGGTGIIGEGCVMCLTGDYQGASFPVKAGAELVIGKDPARCNVVIDQKYTTVSRKHVGIRYDAQQYCYIVTDYSSNGTYMDGEKLEPKRPTYLKAGKTIHLGKSDYSFRLG